MAVRITVDVEVPVEKGSRNLSSILETLVSETIATALEEALGWVRINRHRLSG